MHQGVWGPESGASPGRKGGSELPVPPGAPRPIASWDPCKAAAAAGPAPQARSEGGREGSTSGSVWEDWGGVRGSKPPPHSAAQAGPAAPWPPSTSSSTHRDTSACVFLSPSRVKGEAPVSSSKSKMPRLHQSTACGWSQGESLCLPCLTPPLSTSPSPTSLPTHLAMPRLATDDFRGHVLNGATEGEGPLFLGGQEVLFRWPSLSCAPAPHKAQSKTCSTCEVGELSCGNFLELFTSAAPECRPRAGRGRKEDRMGHYRQRQPPLTSSVRNSLLSPKSVRTMWPSESSSTFSSFRSR